LNRAIYALNQGRPAEAQARLHRLQSSLSEDRRSIAQVYLAESLIRQGKFEQANEALAAADSAGNFWRAVALYELGGDEPVVALLREFLSDEKASSRPERRALAELGIDAMAKDGHASSVSQELILPSSAVLERSLAAAWTGRIQLKQRQFAAANQSLQSALELGDTNAATRVLACTAASLAGNYSKAQLYLDKSTSAGATLRAVRAELQSRQADALTSSVAADAFSQKLLSQNQLTRAMLWYSIQASRYGTQGLPGSSPEAGADAIAEMLQGDLLVQEQHPAEAYAIYRKAASTQRHLPLLLRQLDVAGSENTIAATAEEFAQSIPSAMFSRCNETSSPVSVSASGILSMHEPGVIQASFTTAQAGSYEVALQAKADHAANLGPVINLAVDTFSSEQLYLAREGWDCYSATFALPPGDHVLRLTYTKESDAVSTAAENRGFYLAGIIIMPVQAEGN
jgi:hypothetical protein